MMARFHEAKAIFGFVTDDAKVIIIECVSQ
jgi:hypothetical protein